MAMGFKRNLFLVLVILVAGVSGAAGCGGSDSDSSGSSPQGAAKSTTSEKPNSEPGTSPSSGSSAPTKEFLGKGPNGQLAKVGKESTVAEREAVTRVLEKSFNARAAGDWETQCSTLSTSLIEQLEKGAALGGKADCSKVLQAQASGVPAPARANTMTGPIDALRINEGFNGFAFWHGTENRDFIIPLIKEENGEWKLVAPQEEELRN
jgi:hypothetical protein